MSRGIDQVRANETQPAKETFQSALELYQSLAERCDRPEIRLLAQTRRIHSRIRRILDALDERPGIEYFDVLDERGGKTGERVASTLAHLRGTRHPSIEIIFFNRAGEMLLQRRSPGLAVFPGKLTFAATGHVASGVETREAAHEEITEEIASPIALEDAANLSRDLHRHIERRNDGRDWLRFEPRDENLIQIGEDNAFEGELYIAEFAYWDGAERDRLETEAARLCSMTKGKGIRRLLFDVDSNANTLSFFTLDSSLCAQASETAARLSSATDIPRGMITDNVERKSLYLYKIADDEMPLLDAIMRLKRGGAPIDASMTVSFEWKPFEAVVHDFLGDPGGYTDGFVPFLSSPEVLKRIREQGKF